MKRIVLAAALLQGCAASPALEQCGAQVDELRGRLAAESTEHRRQLRAAGRREEALRQQLEAMKSIERGILEREGRLSSDTR
jgi:uncharacterized protein involved in exopolysaccharide biosynthesis